MTDDLVKTMPCNLEAEEAVLGSILADPSIIAFIESTVKPEDFFYPKCREVYSAMVDLNSKGVPSDFITLGEELEHRDVLSRIGGQPYVMGLRQSATSPENAEHYASIVARKSSLRQLLASALKITNIAYADDEDAVEQAEAEILKVSQAVRTGKQFRLLSDILIDYAASIGDLTNRDNTVFTGLDIDEVLKGLHASDLVILAARTSMGKSALCQTIANNVAAKGSEYGVGMFTLEMSELQVAQRFLSMESGLGSDKLEAGHFSSEDIVSLQRALDKYKNASIYIDDTPFMSVIELRSKAKRLFLNHPNVKLLIVDYLQLVSGTKKGASETESVTEVSRMLKALARDLNIPVLALAQLNRDVESRKPPIPMLSDLRSSGAIEQDADVVMFIYREDKYDEDSDRPNIADIYVAKHRNGPTGKVELFFHEETTRFYNTDKVDKPISSVVQLRDDEF